MMSLDSDAGHARVTTVKSTDSPREKSRMMTASTTKSMRGEMSLRKASTQELSAVETALLTFEGQDQLCRGSRLTDVMGRCGKIFANAAGSALTYDMSQPTPSIHTFISHNWVVGRFQKWMCLGFHFNFIFAFWFLQCICIPMYIGMWFNVFPHHYEVSEINPEFVRKRTYLPLIACPLFLFLVLFGHNVKRWIGMTDELCFLDKTCIHQTDREIQRAGIVKLGAFLRKSRHFLIIHTEVYFQKLWTVYECVSFMALLGSKNPTKEQRKAAPWSMIKTSIPVVVLMTVAIMFLQLPWNFLIHSMAPPKEGKGANFYQDDATERFVDWFMWMLFLFASFRPYTRVNFNRMIVEVHFSMADLKCFCEDDRPVVYANIAGLMRAAGWCEEDADDKEALFSFEDYTRTVISGICGANVGSGMISYWQFLIMFSVIRTPMDMDWYLSPQPDYGFEIWRFRVGKILFHLMEGLGLCPFIFEFIATWCACWGHRRGCGEILWMLLGFLIAYIPVIFTRMLDPVTAEDHSNINLVKLAGWTVFMAIIGFAMFEISKLIEGWRPTAYRKMMPTPHEQVA